MSVHSMNFLALWLLIGAIAPQSGAGNAEVPIPEKLNPPKDHVVLFRAKAEGFQIYTCKARADDPKTFEWALKAPDASLVNDEGKKFGKHYAGPTWEGTDGSKVIAKLMEKAPAPKEGDIPWLLLKANENAGNGLFAKVTYIQRINTEGGMAPAQGCDSSHVGNEARVKYKAAYIFYGKEE